MLKTFEYPFINKNKIIGESPRSKRILNFKCILIAKILSMQPFFDIFEKL